MAIILAVFAAIFIPWENLYVIRDNILGIGESYASLKIYSLGGDMEVYLDDESKGIVRAQDSFLEVFPIEVGEHSVKLIREESEGEFYPGFKRVILFEKGFETVISWEIGPTYDSSSGWILYAKKMVGDEDYAYLNIRCEPEDCSLQENDGDNMEAPISDLELSLDSRHSYRVSGYGYQDLEFQILPEEEEARLKLGGYDLFLEVNLYKIPI